MNDHPSNTETMVRDYLDGTLPHEARGAFLHRLRNEREALDILAAHALMDANLRQAARGTMPVVAKHPMTRHAWRAAAAAACLAIVATLLWFVAQPRPEATFTVSPYTNFTLEGRPAEPGRLPKGGTLVLTQGAAELKLPTGVKCIATAPSRVTLTGRNSLAIADGLAHFVVPESGKGFTVRSHDLEVVDQGTEFTIDATRRGHNEAHVLRGEIEVRTLKNDDVVSTLGEGQAVRVEGGALQPMAADSGRFMSRLPDGLPALRFPFDPDPSGKLPVLGSLAENASVTILPRSEEFQSPQTVAGRSGKALRFPDNHHSLQTTWPGIEGAMARSVSFWVRSEPDGGAGKYMPLVAWGLPAGPRSMANFSIELGGRSGNLHLRVSSGRRWLEGASVLDDGKWHHVVIVLEAYEPGNWPVIKAHVNGRTEPLVQRLPEDLNAAPLESFYTVVDDPRSVPLTFGRYSLWREYPSQPWEIDEVVIAAGILLPKQIEALHRGETDKAGLAVGGSSSGR